MGAPASQHPDHGRRRDQRPARRTGRHPGSVRAGVRPPPPGPQALALINQALSHPPGTPPAGFSRVLAWNAKTTSDNALIYKGDFVYSVLTALYSNDFVSSKPLIYK